MNKLVNQTHSFMPLKESYLFNFMYRHYSFYDKAMKFIEGNSTALSSLLEDNEYATYTTNFCKHYYKDFISSLPQSSEFICFKDDNYTLFFQLIKKLYNLSDTVILASLILTENELRYTHYSNYVGNSITTWEQLLDKTLFYDIKYDKSINIDYIDRKLNELKLKIKLTFLESKQEKIKCYYTNKYDELQMTQYASLLMHDIPFTSINDALRLDILKTVFENEFNISFNPDDYYIGPHDCLRDNNKLDNYYKQTCGDLLIKTFGGCAKCGTLKMGENMLTYDHFWLPKHKCGNFAMRSKTGYYINNCIPLCTSCNSSKGTKNIFEFFSSNELDELLKKSQSLNPQINHNFRLFDDKDFPNRKI